MNVLFRKTGLKLNAKKTKIIHIKGKDSQNEEHSCKSRWGCIRESYAFQISRIDKDRRWIMLTRYQS